MVILQAKRYSYIFNFLDLQPEFTVHTPITELKQQKTGSKRLRREECDARVSTKTTTSTSCRPHPLYSKGHWRRWQAVGVKGWTRITMDGETQDRMHPSDGGIT